MSNKKKPKKLRTPNVPTGQAAMGTAPAVAAPVRSLAQSLPSPSRQMRPAPSATAAPAAFDYTYVKKDLGRIAILAASFIVVLVVLSFFIH
jgi:hypothetical protein